MAKNFVQVGKHLTVPASDSVYSGDVVQAGAITGIALTDAKTDDGTNYRVVIAIDGVWSIPVSDLESKTVSVGDIVKVQPVDSSTYVAIGYAIEAATDADDTVPVLLCLGMASV